MRKLFGVALVLAGAFLFAPAANAQFTTVTATVKDPSGIPYAGAILNAVLVPSTGGGYTLNGQPYSGRIGPVTLDASGSFTVNFGDVTLITPGSPQWQITIDSAAATIALPLGTGPQTFTFTSTGTTISGSSPVSLTASLNALAPKLTNFAGSGSGSVTSVAATSPIVVTPSPITTTGTISCPTCNTSSATIAGSITSTHIPYASAANTLADVIGSAVTGATGAIALTAGADTTVPFSIIAHSSTQSADLLDISPSVGGILDFINAAGKLQVPNFLDQGQVVPTGSDALTQLGFIGSNGGTAGASTNGFKGAGAFMTVGDGSAGGATTGNGGTGGDWTIGGGNGGAAGGTTTNNGGNGGAVNWGLGNGGAAAATGNGGAAGTFNVNTGTPTSGTGGAGGATSGTGGRGADINLASGVGGAAAVGSTTGRGGNITLSLGAAGATGTPGVPGSATISRGTGPQGTNTTPLLSVLDTWNTSGVVDALILANVTTDTASGAGSLLMDLQHVGTSEFTVDKTGIVKPANSVLLPNGAVGTPSLSFAAQTTLGLFRRTGDSLGFPWSGGTEMFEMNGGVGARIPANYTFAWTSTNNANGSPDTGFSRLSANVVAVGNGLNGDVTGTIEPGKYATGTNCSSSASPAVCSSAAAGSVALPTNAVSSSIVVQTTAVTANSQIFVQTDDTLGTKLSVTCNSTVATLVGGLTISARTAGTSFTIANNVAVVTNPLCVSYFIVN